MVKSTNSSTNTYVGEEMGPGGLLYLQLIAVDPPIQMFQIQCRFSPS